MPDCEETQTWDDVFSIKHRFAKYGLEEYYKAWLRQFINWASGRNKGKAWNVTEVKEELEQHALWLSTEVEYDKRLVRSALFRFLHQLGDVNFLQNLANQLENRRLSAGLS